MGSIFNGVKIMKGKISVFFLLLMSISNSFGQNLNLEKARAIEGHKTGIFVEEGIFYKSASEIKSELKGFRRSGDKEKTKERVVIDFSTKSVPRIYSYLSNSEKILYVDFFNTEIKVNNPKLENSTFVDSIKIYPWKDDKLSMEIKLKDKVFCDLFYLENQGRLVIDMRKGL